MMVDVLNASDACVLDGVQYLHLYYQHPVWINKFLFINSYLQYTITLLEIMTGCIENRMKK